MRERPRVYLITPTTFEPNIMADRLHAAFEGGDIACVQLRLKDVPDQDVVTAARKLLAVTHAHDAAFLVNDRADLAERAGADGVHLGQADMSVKEARRILGPDKDIGATCHNSRHLAFEAGDAGANYVAFGAFYPSGTKEPPAMADPEILRWWSELAELPCVAVGGITADNCAPLVEAGADFLAVSGYVWHHPDGPAAAVAALNKAIDEAFDASH